MALRRSIPEEVQEAFDAYPADVRERLLELRELVFATAEQTPGVGPLEETLKWGQPAYVTAETGSGTTIRLGPARDRSGKCCLFVHCQTTLVDRFREEFDGEVEFDGTRAVVFNVNESLPERTGELVAAALTYHRGKQKRR